MKRNSENILDEWLVISAQAGDVATFTRLIRRWRPKLLAYANSQLRDKESANDVTQDTLLYVSQSLGSLRDPVAFPNWVYKILHRRCVDAIRRKHTRRKYEVSMNLNDADTEHLLSVSESDEAEKMLRDRSLAMAVHNLEPSLSQVIRLFYLEDFNVKEMEEILCVPEGTVKSRLFTARKHLKSILEE